MGRIMNQLREGFMQSLAVAWKEMQLLAGDRGTLIVFFVLPLLMGSMVGSMYGQQSGGDGGIQIPLYVVNEDAGPYGAQIAEVLRGVDVLDVKEIATRAEADALVGQGERPAAIVIPADLSARVDTYEPVAVQVIGDPAQKEFVGLITGMMNEVVAPIVTLGEVQYGVRRILDQSGILASADPQVQRAALAQSTGVIMSQLYAMQETPRVSLLTESMGGVEVTVPTNAFAVSMPGFTVWFAFFIVGSISSSLLKEREEGTLRRLLAAPIPSSAIILGKMLAFLVIAVLQVVVLFSVGNLAFDMPLGSSPLGLALVTLAVGLAATSLGMMVAALAGSARQADGVGMVLGFVLAGLGGCLAVGLTPLYRMEGPLGVASRLTPHAHALEAYRRLMLEGGGVIDVLPQVGIVIGMSALFFLVARWRFQLDR
jgi:ABC-2 type transport system permease protein